MNGRIYLDYNATTPVSEEVIECIRDSMIYQWTNPSSCYPCSVETKEAIENARKKVANLIGAQSQEIVFTSGGTESNNLVFHSLISESEYGYMNSQPKNQFNVMNGKSNGSVSNGDCPMPHVIISCVEHDSVLLTARMYEKQSKIRLTELKINPQSGKLDLKHLKQSICSDTRLVSVMLANNETGIIQPIQEISKILKEYTSTSKSHTILLHTDAAQAIGKISVSVDELGVDYLTIAGHKFYGPRTGALYVRNHLNIDAVPLIPMLYGGGQENGFRPGTENTAMIVGLGKAAELVLSNLTLYQQRMLAMRNLLEKELLNLATLFASNQITVKMLSWFPDNANTSTSKPTSQITDQVELFDSIAHRLPNTCSVAFCFNDHPQMTGSVILSRCSNICASVGSACHGVNTKGSKVLLNCGKSTQEAQGAVRLSVGRETTEQDVKAAVQDIRDAIKGLLEEKKRFYMNGDLELNCAGEPISTKEG